MKTKYLVLGDGLLGNTFKLMLPNKSIVLSKALCDITKREDVVDALNYYNPDIVINAAGIVPKNTTASIEDTFRVNSFAPHYIADICYRRCNFIHISTDCVFSGKSGNYRENDKPDATDIYGMSKIMGEPENCMVIRTSFVGLPDPKGRGLFAWALEQKEIIGYDRTYWNGITTLELIRKIEEYSHEYVRGLRHVYSYSLSKYELLKIAAGVYGWRMPIFRETEERPDDCHTSNKTLSSIYATGFIAKPIRQQLMEMRNAFKE